MHEELPEIDRPTKRQLSYAASLGVQVLPGMTKRQLSDAISEVELKAKDVTADPPTEREHRDAALLGIQVPPGMTRGELGGLIWDAEHRKQAISLGVQVLPGMTNWEVSKAISDAKLLREVGPESFEEHRQWEQCTDKYRYALVAYTRRKETIVDVLDFGGGVNVGPRGKITFTVAAPKLVKDPDLGRILEWEKQFELPLKSMLYYDPLAFDVSFGLDEAGIAEYVRIVERGLAIARDPAFVRKVSPCLT